MPSSPSTCMERPIFFGSCLAQGVWDKNAIGSMGQIPTGTDHWHSTATPYHCFVAQNFCLHFCGSQTQCGIYKVTLTKSRLMHWFVLRMRVKNNWNHSSTSLNKYILSPPKLKGGMHPALSPPKPCGILPSTSWAINANLGVATGLRCSPGYPAKFNKTQFF